MKRRGNFRHGCGLLGSRSWATLAIAAGAVLFSQIAPQLTRGQELLLQEQQVAKDQPVAAPATTAASTEASTPVSTAAPDPLAAAKEQLGRVVAGEEPESVAELRAMEEVVRQITAKVSPATVGVQIGPAQGSGVIISADGYVLTAGHVSGIPNKDAIFILSDGRQVKGVTLGRNRNIDSGLMKITDPGEYPFVEMGDSGGLKAGHWCLAIGHPGGYQPDRQPVLRFGRVLANRRDFLKTDCTLVGGDSGGPLFDLDGKVIGIHSRIGGEITANIHVPIKTYTDTWDRLLAKEEWGAALGSSPFIGVEGEKDVDVAKLAKVFAGMPGDKAGLKPGDTIVRFDNKPVTDFASLAALVGDSSPGDTVKLSIKRGEETLELELTIGAREE